MISTEKGHKFSKAKPSYCPEVHHCFQPFYDHYEKIFTVCVGRIEVVLHLSLIVIFLCILVAEVTCHHISQTIFVLKGGTSIYRIQENPPENKVGDNGELS